jgi:hypothetical protein
MKIPRVRFTIGRLMFAVAVVGLLLGAIVGVENRRRRFLALASIHRAKMIAWEEVGSSEASRERFDISGRKVSLEADRWHSQMAEKYKRAAERPWLPVEPDPPEPEDTP